MTVQTDASGEIQGEWSEGGAGSLGGARSSMVTLEAFGDDILRVRLAEGDAAPDLALARSGVVLARLDRSTEQTHFAWGDRQVRVSSDPLTITIETREGKALQMLRIGEGMLAFEAPPGPRFGLGQGGQQFDRRGGHFPLVNGQSGGEKALSICAERPDPGFDLFSEGARITIPWVMGTNGWGFYLRKPAGVIDLDGSSGTLTPANPAELAELDAFIVLADDPCTLLGRYAEITGFPHLPPRWAFGYMQSHRTLESVAEMISEADRFRDSDLPCDAMIYLGTGFSSSGWNTEHGSFAFNDDLVPDPQGLVDALHARSFRVILHVVNPPLHLHGRVTDGGPAIADPESVAQYWQRHEPVAALGIDGWWPDIGDMLSPKSRLARIRMYWEGPRLRRPDVRPFAFHRNAWAGIQRYGWLWSGDIDAAWATLAKQVPVGLNCAVTGIPYWGTDTGGFFTTPELTGELFVRWFQYSSFCPLFRAHGKTWKLRLPWGWNTGEYGPEEYDDHRVVPGSLPDPAELHNPEVEPICRKYLNLRYRFMTYTYSAAREAQLTGLPIMRPLWLHYPDDPEAVGVSDQYLWGRDILVSPVTEKAATARSLYLPEGQWHDFWTGERLEGGRRIERPVDLATLPLHVRAGTVLPLDPVRQYAEEPSDVPLTLRAYPGADGWARIHDDDGIGFGYESGDFCSIEIRWDNAAGTLTLALGGGSGRYGLPRMIRLERPDTGDAGTVRFDGQTVTCHLG